MGENYLHTNIKFLRKQSGKSQDWLALQLNKTNSTIGNWENKVSEPDVQELLAMANIFGVSLQQLVCEDLQKGNLIEISASQKTGQKGNLKGNLSGNLSDQKDPKLYPHNDVNSLVTDPAINLQLDILMELKKISRNIELLRLSGESVTGKKK